MKFRVMDEDQDKNDDAMGQISIDLATVPVNVGTDYKLALEQVEGSKIAAKGWISVTVTLYRNTNIFRIIRGKFLLFTIIFMFSKL